MLEGQVDAGFQGRTIAFQREHEVPAVAAGAARAGKTLWAEACGWADVVAGRRVEPATQFRIGSITKTFTAAVVLGLSARGALDLDEPVERYLPGLDLGRPRIRQLLAHSGGVQREVPGSMWSTMRGPDAEGLMAALTEAVPVDRPGGRWHYSNLGYAVLGQVVAAVTGDECQKIIDTTLLAPPGLTDTTWRPKPDAAVGYRKDPYRDDVHPEPVMDQGAVGVGGQLWSTVGDLLVWGDALAGGAPDVVAAEVVDRMHTLQVVSDPAAWRSGWGLGLALTRCGDRVAAGHTGAMPGFAAALTLDRSTRTVVAALASLTRGADVAGLAAELLAGSLGESSTQVAEDVAEPWRPGPPCPTELDGVLGRWWCEAEETVVSWRAGRLRALLAQTPQTAATVFEPLGPDHFRAVEGRLRGEHLLVERAPDGTVQQLTWATYPYTRTPR